MNRVHVGHSLRVGGDNAATAVKATRAQSLDFIAEARPKGIDEFETSPHPGTDYLNIVKFVQEMENVAHWVLVES